ncbi:efflux transporter outer membrane subunit [Paucimonas lemoignei]|nr:efflux transporter outer membrane subunit [Paucimonas lemoignei]
MRMSLPFLRRSTFALSVLLAIGGCAVGPDYHRPDLQMPANFKEAEGWVKASPADHIDRGAWWQIFNDPVLNELAAAVEVSNQNVAAAAAAYAQARALVQQQRASFFPVVSLTGSANRNAGSGDARASNRFQLGIGGSWEPDVWGRLRRSVSAAGASAQASAADLASATLSAQGELVANYISIRQIDTARALLADTIAAYQRNLQITQNRYNAGIAGKTDVLQAQTQLANAQSDELGLVRQRAQFEHAIAVLIGKLPAEFSLPATKWQANVPAVPVGVPSLLLQRRPDIAAAERFVAVANEQIGIAKSAYFPSIALNASLGSGASNVADLFAAGTSVWALGLSLAQSVFNAGATRARVEGAQAGYEEAVARYRQTVLSAFADVEDQLSAARILAEQETYRRQASQAADEAEARMLNRYKEGQVGYSEVVLAQASALNARRALVQVQADRQLAAVSLIQALGGGWQAE